MVSGELRVRIDPAHTILGFLHHGIGDAAAQRSISSGLKSKTSSMEKSLMTNPGKARQRGIRSEGRSHLADQRVHEPPASGTPKEQIIGHSKLGACSIGRAGSNGKGGSCEKGLGAVEPPKETQVPPWIQFREVGWGTVILRPTWGVTKRIQDRCQGKGIAVDMKKGMAMLKGFPAPDRSPK